MPKEYGALPGQVREIIRRESRDQLVMGTILESGRGWILVRFPLSSTAQRVMVPTHIPITATDEGVRVLCAYVSGFWIALATFEQADRYARSIKPAG